MAKLSRLVRPVFKDYLQNQTLLLPPSLEELIAPHHPVWVVNEVINKINMAPILSAYAGGGCRSYHPSSGASLPSTNVHRGVSALDFVCLAAGLAVLKKRLQDLYYSSLSLFKFIPFNWHTMKIIIFCLVYI